MFKDKLANRHSFYHCRKNIWCWSRSGQILHMSAAATMCPRSSTFSRSTPIVSYSDRSTYHITHEAEHINQTPYCSFLAPDVLFPHLSPKKKEPRRMGNVLNLKYGRRISLGSFRCFSYRKSNHDKGTWQSGSNNMHTAIIPRKRALSWDWPHNFFRRQMEKDNTMGECTYLISI